VEEVAAAKKNLGWPVEPEFFVPEDVLEHMRGAVERDGDRRLSGDPSLKVTGNPVRKMPPSLNV